MSKSASTSVQRNPSISSQLPSRSAWARGPPQVAAVNNASGPNTSRPSSPAITPQTTQQQSSQQVNNVNLPTPSHSRRPSALSGARDMPGVSIPPRAINSKSSASPVTFGSIDNPSAPLSTSPSGPSYLNSKGNEAATKVHSFGSLQAEKAPANINQSNLVQPTTSSTNVNGRINPSAAGASAVTSSASTTGAGSAKPPVNSPSLSTTTRSTTPSSTNTSTATTSATSTSTTTTPAKPKFDPRQLFRGGGTPAPTPPQPSNTTAPSYPSQTRPETSSPAPVIQHLPQPSPPIPRQAGGYPYSPRNPASQLHPAGGQPPRSPNFPRGVPNGRVPPGGAAASLSAPGGVGAPPNIPGGAQVPHSPRMPMANVNVPINGQTPPVIAQQNTGNGAPPVGVGVPPPMSPPPPGQGPPGAQPQMMHGMWPGYYYPPYGMENPYMQGQHPQYGQYYQPQPPHQTHQHQPHHLPPHQVPPHQQQHPPPHQPAGQHTQSHLQSHAPPHSPRLPHAQTNQHQAHPGSPHVVSPPLTSPPPASPSISSRPTPSNTGNLSSRAPSFVPKGRIIIKDSSGKEVALPQAQPHQTHRRDNSSISIPAKPSAIRMESEDARKARLAAEKKKEEEAEAEKRKKEEAIEAEKKKKEEEEKERIRKKEEEKERIRKEKEEEERTRKEKEENERLRKENEEKERIRKEEEEKEKERLRIKEEEEEREREKKRKEEEEERVRKEKEDQERAQKEKEEAEAKRKFEEEEERLKKEEEEKLLKQREEDEKKAAAVTAPSESKPPASTEAFPKKDKTFTEEPETVSELPPSPATSAVPPPKQRRPIPGPLDLSSTAHRTGSGLPIPLPSALLTARRLNSLDEVKYPEHIQSPRPDLNSNAQEGKFKYDRDFLLQFMKICKERPDNLVLNEVIGKPDQQAPETPHPLNRTASGRRNRVGSQPMPPPSGVQGRQGSVGLGIPMNQRAQGGFQMGQFGTPNRHVTGPVMGGGFPGGKPGMTRAASQGGVGGMPNQPSNLGSNRHRGSRKGHRRPDGNLPQSNLGTPVSGHAQLPSALEPIAPLEVSANRWVAGSVAPSNLGRRGQPVDESAPEIVDRKVKGLLNKLSMEKFDSISDQIIEWANKSEKENDGRTLMRVIRLVFEKATDEATWSEMYARLCRKMLEKISTNVIDESIKTPDGKPFAGGQLFRKYLLNRCQEDFERGWQMKEAAAAAAASKADGDKAAAAAVKEGEEDLYSDEYYAFQKAKRQGLGLVKFIGELFKLQMLTERIMHECIKKLLQNVDNPAEEEIESLCKLLTTIGQQLDTPKAVKHMDVYFTRMKELSSSSKIASRMQFMLVGVIELRENKWRTRNQVAAPTTIAAVHEQAAKEKLQAERDSFNRGPMPMSRGGSRRGEHSRDFSQTVGPDGWTTTGPAAAPTRPSAKAGDLSQFGKINKVSQSSLGPSAVFRKEGKQREPASLSRSSSSANMFSMLNTFDASVEPAPSRGSQPPSRKPSSDFTQMGIPGAPGGGRRKLNLLPRSVPKEDGTQSPITPNPDLHDSDSEVEEGEIREGEVQPEKSMSKEDAERKVKEDVKELFSVRSLDEAEEYFKALPSEHHPYLIGEILTRVLDKKESDAKFVASFFDRAVDKNLCSPAQFEEGFNNTMEPLDDLSVDVPAAFKLVAIVVKGTRLPRDAVDRLSEKILVEGDPLVSPKAKFIKEYEKLE